jgi:transcriptional regulator with XRE-family HTH domain
VELGRLREWREARGLTQDELAHEAAVGPKTIARIELGDSVRTTTARKVADAIGVSVADLMRNPPVPLAGTREASHPGKASAPVRAGDLSEMLDDLGAKSKHLADPDLLRDLEGASDAAVGAVIGEIRQEMELLIPELRRRSREAMPGDPDFMPTNLILGEASRQVLMWNLFLRARTGVEPQEVEIDAFRDLSGELVELAGVG